MLSPPKVACRRRSFDFLGALQSNILVLAVALCLTPPLARAAAFDCVANRCGIVRDAPNPDFVVGTVDGVTTPAQTALLFTAARRDGLWRMFPPPPAAFAAKIQPISILFAPGHSITVLSAAWEARLLRLQPGEMVRFAPHRGLHEKPRPDDPYWVGVGCVVLLCVPGDTQCQQGYRSGLYRVADGAELDDSGRAIVPNGIMIDPISMRPKKD